MIRALLLDMDDTLYDESAYVASGFREVARELAGWSGVAEEEIEAFLQAELARSGRGRIFDAALAAFGQSGAGRVEALVARYRGHRPRIALFPDAAALLDRLRPRYRVAVVTDGLPSMQRKKFEALGLAGRVDALVCNWEIGAPKPDPRGFLLALRRLGVGAAEALIVGDRPDHDIAAARALGVRSVRLRRGRFAALDAAPHLPDHELATLDELPALLTALEEAR